MKAEHNTPLWVAALLDKNLLPVEFRLWMLLYRYQGTHECAWPSQTMIGADLGLTAEGVRRITKRLEAAGWLTVEWSKGPGRGPEHRKQYIVTHPQDPPPAVQVLRDENPNSGLGIAAENPTGHTVKTPPAKPRHIGRSNSISKSSTARAVSYPPAFERFWTEYPRKTGKLEAFREWQAIDPDDALIEKIILSVQAWKRSEQWTKDGGKYVVYPARFLKHRRFEDELPCSPEPQRGDPDWLPDEDAPQVEAAIAKIGGRP